MHELAPGFCFHKKVCSRIVWKVKKIEINGRAVQSLAGRTSTECEIS